MTVHSDETVEQTCETVESRCAGSPAVLRDAELAEESAGQLYLVTDSEPGNQEVAAR